MEDKNYNQTNENQYKKQLVERLLNVKGQFGYYLKMCPMATILVLSMVVVMVVSLFLTSFGRYRFQVTFDHPLFVSVMRKEYKERKQEENVNNSVEIVEANQTEISTEVTEEQITGIPTEYETYQKTKVNSPYYSDPGKVALTTNYPYITVEKSYYDDALFIGDSRVEGLKLYSQIDNATYYCRQGISVYNMMTEKIAKSKGKATTIPKALKSKKFNKIYIMVGINELGIQNTKAYAKKYKENIEEIKKLQPDAVIFIMGVMKVTDAYANKSDIVNNVNINDKNVAAANLANGIDIFYIDMNPVVTKKNGGVRSDYTWDGIHLKAEYYGIWDEFLNTHGLPDEMFPAYANH